MTHYFSTVIYKFIDKYTLYTRHSPCMVQPEFWMATHLLFKMMKEFACENIDYVCALKSNDSPLICVIDYYFTHLSH